MRHFYNAWLLLTVLSLCLQICPSVKGMNASLEPTATRRKARFAIHDDVLDEDDNAGLLSSSERSENFMHAGSRGHYQAGSASEPFDRPSLRKSAASAKTHYSAQSIDPLFEEEKKDEEDDQVKGRSPSLPKQTQPSSLSLDATHSPTYTFDELFKMIPKQIFARCINFHSDYWHLVDDFMTLYFLRLSAANFFQDYMSPLVRQAPGFNFAAMRAEASIFPDRLFWAFYCSLIYMQRSCEAYHPVSPQVSTRSHYATPYALGLESPIFRDMVTDESYAIIECMMSILDLPRYNVWLVKPATFLQHAHPIFACVNHKMETKDQQDYIEVMMNL